MQVFRYFDTKGAAHTLNDRAFRLSDPRQCNDPFEMMSNNSVQITAEQIAESLCTGPMIRLFHEQWGSFEGLTPEQSEKIYRMIHVPTRAKVLLAEQESNEFAHRISMADAMAEDVRILCCSHTHESILMWSHYAAKHHGIVIEFETSQLGSAKPVIREILYRTKAPPSSIDLSEIVSTKAAEWSYEEEVRLQYAITDASARDGHYFVDFDPISIKSVIFGCRFSFSKEEDIDLGLTLLEPHYQHVRVKQAKQRGQDYRLLFDDIDVLQRLQDENEEIRSIFAGVAEEQAVGSAPQ